MKRFRFRLETLLGARRTQERARTEALGQHLRELAAESERLDALRAERLQTVRTDPEGTAGGAVDMNEVRLTEAWRNRLTERIHLQSRRVDEAATRSDEAREALLAAARDRSVVERLREKRALEHHDAVVQEDQKVQDDVAGRLARNERGNALLLVLGLIVVYVILFTGILKVTGILDKQIIPRMTGQKATGADSLASQAFPAGNIDKAARLEAIARITTERDSLGALSQRLTMKTQEMTAQLELLTTAKHEIDTANAEADSLARVPAAGVVGFDDLARVYSSMKPQELSPILARLNDDTTFGVAQRLKGRQLAKFLSALPPEKAAAMSERLAGGAPAPTP